MAAEPDGRPAAAWARRIGAVVAITFLGRLVGFLYLVVVLRRLDSAAAGLAFFFVNTAYFVVQPVSGGPAITMVSPIAAAADDDERAQWLRAAISALVPGVALAAAIAVIVCVSSRAPIAPMLLLVGGLSFDTMYFQVLTARHRYAAAATYRLISNVAQLVILAVALALGFDSVTLVVAIFASSYLFGFAAVEPRQRALIALLRRAVSATRSQRRKLAEASVPTVFTGVAFAGLTGFDTYLVRLSNHSVLATYGAAKTLAAPFLLVSLAVATIVQPEVARSAVEQAKAIRGRILRVGAVVGLLAVAACWSLAGLAVQLVYGSRYPGAAATLRWVGTGATFVGLHTLLQVWCWGRGLYRAPLISLGTGALVATGLNLLLVPQLGAEGAGISVLAGASLATFLLTGLSRMGTRSARLPEAEAEAGAEAEAEAAAAAAAPADRADVSPVEAQGGGIVIPTPSLAALDPLEVVPRRDRDLDGARHAEQLAHATRLTREALELVRGLLAELEVGVDDVSPPARYGDRGDRFRVVDEPASLAPSEGLAPPGERRNGQIPDGPCSLSTG